MRVRVAVVLLLMAAWVQLALCSTSSPCSSNAHNVWQTCPLLNATQLGAQCIDGSDYIYFLRPATNPKYAPCLSLFSRLPGPSGVEHDVFGRLHFIILHELMGSAFFIVG